MRLSPRAKPQPDGALLRRRSYVSEEPGAEDVLFLVEVASGEVRWRRQFDETIELSPRDRKRISRLIPYGVK